MHGLATNRRRMHAYRAFPAKRIRHRRPCTPRCPPHSRAGTPRAGAPSTSAGDAVHTLAWCPAARARPILWAPAEYWATCAGLKVVHLGAGSVVSGGAGDLARSVDRVQGKGVAWRGAVGGDPAVEACRG